MIAGNAASSPADDSGPLCFASDEEQEGGGGESECEDEFQE